MEDPFAAECLSEDLTQWASITVPKRPPTLDEAIEHLVSAIDHTIEAVQADDILLCLSPDNRKLYRRGIDPEYKAGRSEKPDVFWELLDAARREYPVREFPGLEADDVMGLLADTGTVICSSDKDMKTVPGRLYNPRSGKTGLVVPARADWQWMHQTLTGDTTDNYKGARNIGPIKAEAALAEGHGIRDWWEIVKAVFVKQGQTVEDAIRNATLARILRPGDYRDGIVTFKIANEQIRFDASKLAA